MFFSTYLLLVFYCTLSPYTYTLKNYKIIIPVSYRDSSDGSCVEKFSSKAVRSTLRPDARNMPDQASLL